MRVKVQTSQHELRSGPFHEDTFVPPTCTGLDLYRSKRRRELAGQESDQLVVGGAIDRRGGYSDFNRVAMKTYTFCGGGFRLNVNGEDRSGFGVLHNCRLHL